MQLISTFYDYTPTASSSASGYPATNLKTIDTNEIWKASTAGTAGTSATITLDLGSNKAVNAVLLNNCNFDSATVYISTNSSYSDGQQKTISITKDDLGVKRAFFAFNSGLYRYVKIVANSAASVALSMGNVIVSNAQNIDVASWSVEINNNASIFESDGGALRIKKKGQARHEFSATVEGPKSRTDAIPIDFDYGVIYTDLGDTADAYIIGKPTSRRKSIKNPMDTSITLNFIELI